MKKKYSVEEILRILGEEKQGMDQVIFWIRLDKDGMSGL